LERAGLPTAVITCLHNLAEDVGANRIVEGKAIPYPLGDPVRPPEEERAYRRRVVQEALKALQTQVDKPTVFETATAP
jgi:betaine reductase